MTELYYDGGIVVSTFILGIILGVVAFAAMNMADKVSEKRKQAVSLRKELNENIKKFLSTQGKNNKEPEKSDD